MNRYFMQHKGLQLKESHMHLIAKSHPTLSKNLDYRNSGADLHVVDTDFCVILLSL